MHIRHHLRFLLLVSMFYQPGAGAQTYPSKPIRIHTSAVGGATDLVSRLVGNVISPALGQPVVVENQSNPNLLATSVAKAAPDGHTVLVWGPAFWVGPLLQETPYDVMRDFVPITTLTRSPSILVVNAYLPVKSVAELVKLAKSRPGDLNYLTGANGSSEHIASELFKSMSGANIVRINYKGGVAAGVPDLITGQIHMTFSSGAIWGGHIKSGKVRALATGGARRSKFFPDLPTVGEALPGFVSESLLVMYAPARTPEAIVRRLNQETIRALDNADVRERLLLAGQEASGGSPEQLTEAIKSEIARVAKIIKDIGAKSGG